jgi:O-antigen ligase
MKVIAFLLNLLIFLVPLAFFPKTSEIFEFNKIILVYIFTILISAFWALECIDKKKIIFRKTRLFMPLLLFLLSQLVAAIFSIDIRTSIFGYYGRFNGGLLSLISYVILYFAFVTFMNKKQTLKFLNTLLITTAIASAYASLEHFGASPSCLIITGRFDISCWVQDIQTRVFGTFGQPNWLAAFLVAVMPLVLAKTLSSPLLGRNDIKHFLFFILLFTTLLFTKSRSGILGFAVSFTAFWSLAFYVYRKNIQKTLAVFSLSTFYILLSAFFIWNPLIPSQVPPTPGVSESGDIRKIVWVGAAELWKKYPLLGTGPETFAYSYYETRPSEHNLTSEWDFIYNKAHNEYLNFLATTGIIGFAGYLLVTLTSLKLFLEKTTLLKASLLAGFASILVTNFFGFSTVTIALLFFLFPAAAEKLK